MTGRFSVFRIERFVVPNTICPSFTLGRNFKLSLNAALAMIEAAAPKDEVEGALAVQMACTHTAAREAAERRAGLCPSLGLGGCRFLFGEFGWRRRPSCGISVAAGGLATPR